jgi:hypothetical protein
MLENNSRSQINKEFVTEKHCGSQVKKATL